MSLDNHTKGHRDRVREKFRKLGTFESYEAYEVLELLLFYAIPRKDTKAIAKNLIKTFGSLDGVFNADVTALLKQPGIGKSTALFIHSLSEAFRFASMETMLTIKGSGDLGPFAVNLMKHKTVEELYGIALSSKNEIITFERLASGNFSSVAIDSRNILKFAIDSKAERLVLVHNHTNDIPLPSGKDIEVTRYLFDIIRAVGVRLVDHIITGKDQYVSLADLGHVPSVNDD